MSFKPLKKKQSVKEVNMISLTTKGTQYEETHQHNDVNSGKAKRTMFWRRKNYKTRKRWIF